MLKKMTLAVCTLLLALCFLGCPPSGDESSDLEGKLLILQAYGPSDDNAAAVSHAFVELYNISDSTINLNDVTMWYADGRRAPGDGVFEAEGDFSWKSLKLTGDVPAGSSFLILGKKSADSARSALKIEDNYGDINSDTLTLGNRSFKVALIEGSLQLDDSIQNPFSHNKRKVAGYIDMVGAANDPHHNSRPDRILGFETEHTRNSASEAIRRKDLNDTNNNLNDFMGARYPDMTPSQIELYKPRNAKGDGPWSPNFPAPPAGE